MDKDTALSTDEVPAQIGSAWETPSLRRAAFPPLGRSINVDIVVIGAGFTGLSCAAKAASAGRSTAVLDGEKIGFGGSGRNAGQWLVGWPGRTPDQIVRQYGAETGARLNKFNVDAVERLRNSRAANAATVKLRTTGVITLARNEKALAALDALGRQWRAVGAHSEMLDRETLGIHINTGRYCGALLQKDGGVINPYAYARALAEEARDAGAEIFEQSRALSISEQAGRWIVRTLGGEVSAAHVAICTNAYGAELWPGLDECFHRIRMAMIASVPMTAKMLSLFPSRAPFADIGALSIFGGMIDDENRFIASVLPSPSANASPNILARGFDAQFRKTFPGLEPPEWTQTWNGDLCVTPDRLPKIYDLAPGVGAAIGYSGAGIAMGGALGSALFEFLRDGRSQVYPISKPTPAPMRRAAPFLFQHVAAPLARFVQRL
ncbi:MAG: NAD(P)/FAD-dependent oxidoreductase [Parvularculaceae bacterium]